MCNVQCARWHAVFRIPHPVSRISSRHDHRVCIPFSFAAIHLLALTCAQQYQFGNQRGAFHRDPKPVERGAFDRGCMRRHQTISTQRPSISVSVHVGRLPGRWENAAPLLRRFSLNVHVRGFFLCELLTEHIRHLPYYRSLYLPLYVRRCWIRSTPK